MPKFIATLPTGQALTRNSERDYSAAWAIIERETGDVRASGFARTDKLARSSGSSEFNYSSGAYERTSRNIHIRRRYKANKAAADARIAAFEQRFELVVVPARIA